MVAHGLLTTRSLGREFDGRRVVQCLDLDLDPGQRVALWGPNGSGKSTVLRCLAGTLSLSLGEASIAGHPVGSVEARRLTGVSLSQERSFYLRLSGRENLTFFARARGHDRRSAARLVAALEDELSLGEILRERVDRCSTGMVLQLAVARALLGEPRLLLLDEPTRSLDRDATERVWAAIDRRPGTELVIATHNEDDVARCDATVTLPV